MQELYSYRERMLQRYSKVGADVSRAVQAIPNSAWHSPLKGGDSSPHQIIARLHALETQLFKPCIDGLLGGADKALHLFDVSKWLQTEYQSDVSFESLQNAYIELHKEMNARLQNLPLDAWILTGRHPWWGKRTLQWWVESSLMGAEAAVGKLVQFQLPSK